jgi:hypothetical protein
MDAGRALYCLPELLRQGLVYRKAVGLVNGGKAAMTTAWDRDRPGRQVVSILHRPLKEIGGTDG